MWSAPVDDPGNWRYEGVSYRKEQDPLNGAPYKGKLPSIDMPLGTPENPHLLYAPDVAKGPDGRYYLYYGFAPESRFPGMENAVFPGSMMVKLADDMHTIISEPVCVANGVDTAKGTGFSRQGCVDKVQIAEDGTIPQIEITSCGLNDGPLPAKNVYQSYIACHLTEKDRKAVGHVAEPAPGEALPEFPEQMPYITEEEADYEKGLKPYITNLREGAVAGFKYFAFDGDEKRVTLELRGTGKVQVLLDGPDGETVSFAEADSTGWEKRTGELTKVTGVHGVYIKVTEGTLDFATVKFE